MSIEQIEGLWLVLIISSSMILLSPLSYWALTVRVNPFLSNQTEAPEENPMVMYNTMAPLNPEPHGSTL